MAKTKQPISSIQANAPLLRRVLVFVIIFVVISGTLGPTIISNGLLQRDHFSWYGPLGKALLFGVISFGLLIYRQLDGLQLTAWRSQNLVWLALAGGSFACAVVAVHKLVGGVQGTYWPVLAHVGLLASLLFALAGCFGPANLRLLYQKFRTQLSVSIGLSVVFIGFLYAVYGLWPVLSGIVLHSIHVLFNLTGIHSVIIPPRSLLFDKFGIEIAQYCSGIESIALFTGLFAIIAVLDWQRFNHRRLLAVFVPALIVLFACNILRVYLLVLAGYYINQHIAFSLFHTYAGMVFFILYSGVFWYFAYDKLLSQQAPAKPVVS